MKGLKRYNTPKLWWLLANLAGVALFFATRDNRTWMNFFTQTVTTPLRIAIGQVTYLVDWSVMEVLYTAAAGIAMLYLGWWIGAICTQKAQRLQTFAQGLLTILNVTLTVYLSFCFFWGLNYYTDGFQEKAGIYAQGGTVEELATLTAYFADQTTQLAPSVSRDDYGLFNESQETLFAQAPQIYDFVEETYPFLAFDDEIPKPMVYSQFMSQMNFTGFYCGYTGESNLNVDSPLVALPFTIAHELAHQRSIASEQEANFLGVLASITSGIPAYEYSGYYMGYIYLSNALYARDYDAWYDIYLTLPDTVRLDMAYQSAYWAQYKDAVSEAGQSTYDALLKSYGQADGIQSYGTVVDLLLAYYQ